MSKAASSLPRSIGAHAALLIYTVIALFPVVVIVINSFKSRNAIFRSPLSFPTPETFDLIGYTTVLNQGDFSVYFQNSFIVTVASLFLVLLFGAMAAFALSEYRFRGNTLMGLYLALGIMIPIRLGTVAILQLMVASGLVNTLTALVLVYTAQGLPLAVFILSEFMKQVSDDLKNAGTDRRAFRVPHLLPAGAAAGAPGHGDGGGLHHDPDLERPLVPADPGAVGGDQDRHARRAALHRSIRHQLERRAGRTFAGDPAGADPLSHLLAAADPRHHVGSSQVNTQKPLRVVVAGLGNMGRSHALAYHNNPGFEIAALVNRSDVKLPAELGGYGIRRSFEDVLRDEKPDVASVNTYSDSHADYAVRALEAGCHVFVEKPLATTVADANRVVAAAKANGRKLVVGYILRHHPSWIRLIAEARKLGGPYVFRMNLNQQSSGKSWETHKQLMKTTSPIVDCGVHYLDVMCQITDAKPVEVRGMGLRLTDEIDPQMYNYGHLQVLFDDGSVGWYEAAWGPMVSETAFFVKDVISPNGCVSIVMNEGATRSDDVDSHTKTNMIRVHRAALGNDGKFKSPDEDLSMKDEPGHQGLCDREQAFLLKAIREDLDLGRHMDDAVRSLAVCLAADESVRTGKAVKL